MKKPLLLFVLLVSGTAIADGWHGGVYYTTCTFGKNSIPCLVDTGATNVSIPYRRAIDLGIPVFAGKRNESTTASGKVGVYTRNLPSVTVGGVTVLDVPADVSLTEAGGQDVILGMSFLSNVRFGFDRGRFFIRP